MLAEHRSTAVEAVDQAGIGSEHLPDGGFAVGTDDSGLDAVALQVSQHRRDALEQRYLACCGELALPHVADDGRQLPHGYVEPCHDLARGQAAQPFHLVVADGRKIEPRDHVLEGGAKPRKGICQRAVEVEDGEAIGSRRPLTIVRKILFCVENCIRPFFLYRRRSFTIFLFSVVRSGLPRRKVVDRKRNHMFNLCLKSEL